MSACAKIEQLVEAFENGIKSIDTELRYEESVLQKQREKVERLKDEKEARKKCIEAIRELQAVLPEDQTITIRIP